MKLCIFLSDHYFAKVLRVLAESFSRSLVKNLYENSAQFLLLCKDGNLKAAETKCNYLHLNAQSQFPILIYIQQPSYVQAY